MNLRDEELAMVVVAARHVMPAPGESPPALLQVHEEQREVPVGDEYDGEAGASSLKWEAQSSLSRPVRARSSDNGALGGIALFPA